MVKSELLFNNQVPSSIKLNSQSVATLLVDGKCFWREYTDQTIAPGCIEQGYDLHTAKDKKNQSFYSPTGTEYPYQYKDNYTDSQYNAHDYKFYNSKATGRIRHEYPVYEDVGNDYLYCTVCGKLIETLNMYGHGDYGYQTHGHYFCSRCGAKK